ncbi:hypothetical protein UFVDC4_00083 [Staphylococcus phage vB_SauM-UFV_DC4]|nr:hypothetical protein UFVDC4_00083 [Staphylococcus phage vB_SauM-UFV_DC4]
MVKKADNNELNDFMSEEELNEVSQGSSNNDEKQEQKQSNQKQQHNKNNQGNKKKNNNRRRNNNNKHNQQDKKQNQNSKSAIPTQRNKDNQTMMSASVDSDNQQEQAKTDHINLDGPQPGEGFVDYENLTSYGFSEGKSNEDNSSMTLSDFEEQQEQKAKKDYENQKAISEIESISSDERANLLNNINVDLDNIEIISDIDYDIDKENTNFVLNSKATHQVVLPQSAYIAHMESLRNQEILSIAESIDDDYNAMLKRYQLYFHKMNTNSLGINNFQDFARLTSVYDVSTIEYGLYNISFPGETKFDIRCGSCRAELKDVKVSNDQLMSFKDEDAFDHVTKNVKNITSVDENKEHSLIYTEQRIALRDSKIIFEIVTPTVEKHLRVLGSIHMDGLTEDESERFKQNATALMHVKNVYIPDLKTLKEGQKPKFRKLSEDNMKDKMKIIENLSIRDGHQLTDAIYDRVNKHAIEYAIKGANCPNCGEDLGKIDIDMSEMLFREALHLV